MNNQEYISAFDEVRDGYKKLHTMGLDKMRIMRVGKREFATISSCEDFKDITSKGQCRCH